MSVRTLIPVKNRRKKREAQNRESERAWEGREEGTRPLVETMCLSGINVNMILFMS